MAERKFNYENGIKVELIGKKTANGDTAAFSNCNLEVLKDEYKVGILERQFGFIRPSQLTEDKITSEQLEFVDNNGVITNKTVYTWHTSIGEINKGVARLYYKDGSSVTKYFQINCPVINGKALPSMSFKDIPQTESNF